MTTFEQVMALATLPETRLPLCLDAKLQGELDVLLVQLGEAGPAASLGERSPASLIQERIDGVVQRMRDAEVTFVIRALSGREWTRLWLVRPERDKDEPAEAYGERLFPWYAQMLSKCCVEPAMTAEQVGLLVDKLHPSAWNALANACMEQNDVEVKVPNFAAVSEVTPNSQTTSPPPSPSGSAIPPSPEHNGRVPRRSPTRKAAKSNTA
jgi:hypothetical protein